MKYGAGFLLGVIFLGAVWFFCVRPVKTPVETETIKTETAAIERKDSAAIIAKLKVELWREKKISDEYYNEMMNCRTIANSPAKRDNDNAHGVFRIDSIVNH